METNVKKFFLKTLENQYNVRIFRKNDVLRCFEKENGVKFSQNGILRVWKPRLVFWSHTTSLSPATVDQRGSISVFFPTGCPCHWMCDPKSSFFSLENELKFCPKQKPCQIFIWSVLDNHCWPRFDSQDWFSWSHTDFSSGLNSGSENFYAEN